MNRTNVHERLGLVQNSLISLANVIACSYTNKPVDVRQHLMEKEWVQGASLQVTTAKDVFKSLSTIAQQSADAYIWSKVNLQLGFHPCNEWFQSLKREEFGGVTRLEEDNRRL